MEEKKLPMTRYKVTILFDDKASGHRKRSTATYMTKYTLSEVAGHIAEELQDMEIFYNKIPKGYEPVSLKIEQIATFAKAEDVIL